MVQDNEQRGLKWSAQPAAQPLPKPRGPPQPVHSTDRLFEHRNETMEPDSRAQTARQVAHTAMRSSKLMRKLGIRTLEPHECVDEIVKVDSGYLLADVCFKNGVWVAIDRFLSLGSLAVFTLDTAFV